jgi:enoyl-CoA hydratase/carnithine racemase
MYLAALTCPKPVVAAVNGYALGAGLIIVMCCDYAVTSTTARFGAPELTLGVAAPLEGLLLPWIVGLGRARAMFYTGRQIAPEEALGMGLVHEVVDPERCAGRALEVAKAMAQLPSNGFAIQKRSMYRLISTGHLDAAIEESHLATSLQFAGDETREGIGRFLASRTR